MTSSRDRILGKLRAARRPFPDAPPRPASYVPVTRFAPDEDLLTRFTAELERLDGSVHPVADDVAAIACARDILRQHDATAALTWDFAHIPVAGLADALHADGIALTQPDIHDERRAETLAAGEPAGMGITGADAALATTGSLIVIAAPGKGRIPTVLPPVHLAIITRDQLYPRLEDWIVARRADGLADIRANSNLCIISGPSRTADIEKNLVLGMHGPGALHVIVKG
jgi:L-lactate dehydrogenase complex protein LldG